MVYDAVVSDGGCGSAGGEGLPSQVWQSAASDSEAQQGERLRQGGERPMGYGIKEEEGDGWECSLGTRTWWTFVPSR
jgi:hypothetical protein